MALSDVEIRRAGGDEKPPRPAVALPAKGVNPVPEFLTEREFSALRAICDTLMPSIANSNDPHGFYKTSASDLSVPECVAQTFSVLRSTAQKAQIKQVLGVFENPTLNFALAGKRKAFSQMRPEERESVLRGWATSHLALRRSAFMAFKKAASLYYYNNTDETGVNPAWAALGYPGPLTAPPNTPKSIVPTAISSDTTLDCDAVIVGSGAGGGVVAGELAAAGKNVIVLEMGGYFTESDFNQRENEMIPQLYLDRGSVATKDQGVMIYAGGCLGGGTTVNWTTSFRTMDTVRHEWATEHGLPVFESQAYDKSLDTVSARINVNSDEGRSSERDAVMERGAQKMGWHNAHMPRNTRDCSQDKDCGYCGMGCQRGAKQSTLKTYLQDAYEHGTRIIVNCYAETIMIKRGRAIGVRATVTDEAGKTYTLTVRAKAVIVAAGSINTPALLLRSHVPNPAIGRYLRLHPAGFVWGIMSEHVETWYGTLQAAYSDEMIDLDGHGYGPKFETGPLHLATHAITNPWQSGKQHKDLMARAAFANAILPIVRETGSGRITIDRQGLPVPEYHMNTQDVHHLRRGLEGAARILEAAGATEIYMGQNRYQPYRPRRDSLADFMIQADKTGYGAGQVILGSAHQMGSCRMGADKRTSVINEHTESHNVAGLFVTDASAFPSASGTNPMLTIMGIAHMAAQYIKTRC